MTSINVQISELSTHRFGSLQERLEASRQETLGVLVLFWAESRRVGVESGTWAEVQACVPGKNPSEVLSALLSAGYVQGLSDNQTFVINDNEGMNARKERRREIMSKAGKASRRAPPKPRQARAPKASPTTALASQPEAAGTGTPAWEAYADAYEQKFSVRPPRSAKTAGQIKTFTQRMPYHDAPHVLRFYLQHPDRRYIARMYSLDMALSDAVALHTQWKAKRVMTESTAGQISSALNYKSERELIAAGLL